MTIELNTDKKLCEIGEFPFLSHLIPSIKLKRKETIVGPGDDTAILRPKHGKEILLTTDAIVEGIHFDFRYMTHYDAGYRLCVSNLSDIASMGGEPIAALITASFPPQTKLKDVISFYSAVEKLCSKYNFDLVGGDMTSSRGVSFFSMSLYGYAPDQAYPLRSSAKPGQKILVSGRLGGTGAGFRLLSNKKELPTTFNPIEERFLKPLPRLQLGRLLVESRLISAMIDLSDGLCSDLRRISEASNTGALIYADRIPLFPGISTSLQPAESPFLLALGSGEEYELLFTADAPNIASLKSFLASNGCTEPEITEIGEIVSMEQGLSLILPDSRKIPLLDTGWDHFVSK
jgi:thiamine-monophosphate kinase